MANLFIVYECVNKCGIQVESLILNILCGVTLSSCFSKKKNYWGLFFFRCLCICPLIDRRFVYNEATAGDADFKLYLDTVCLYYSLIDAYLKWLALNWWVRRNSWNSSLSCISHHCIVPAILIIAPLNRTEGPDYFFLPASVWLHCFK